MRNVLRLVVLAAVVCAIPLSTFAATFVVPSDRDLIRQSDAIFVGSALLSYPQEASYGGIETVTTFSVERVIKGEIGETVDVHEPGGTLKGRTRFIPGTPRFKDGERVLLFVRQTPQGTWAVTNLVLGRFNFATDDVGQKLLVRQDGEIAGWNPDGTVFHDARRRADKFLEFVDTEVQGGVGQTNYRTSEHPLRSSTAALRTTTNTLSTSPSSYLTSDVARWNSFPSAVTFYTYNTSANASAATAAVNAAMASWNNDTGSNVNLVNGGADPGPNAPAGLSGAVDGRNSIMFESNLTARYGAPGFTCSGGGYSGLLGLGGVTSAGAPHTGPGGTSYNTITEADVEMNTGVLTCGLLISTGDINSAVAHEIGHAIGFRHADKNSTDDAACVTAANNECSTSAIMKAFIPNNLSGALQSWDINAVRSIYPQAQCSVPTINTQPANQTITSGQSASLSVSATGATSYQWYTGQSGVTTSPVNGGTGTSITPSPTVTTSYWVRVTNSCGSVDSTTATVTVNSGCSYTLSQTSFTMNKAGGKRSLTVTAGAGCQWTASSPDSSFVSIISGASGTGNGTVTFLVSATGCVNQCARAIVLTVAGQSVTVNQSGPAARSDLNNDGKSDMVWANGTTGDIYGWLMNGPAIGTSSYITANNPSYIYQGTGDFDGDSKTDLIWIGPSNDVWIWLMNGTSIAASGSPYTVAANYRVAGVGDFDGDGKSDIIWFNTVTRDTYVWLMNGTAIKSSAYLYTAAANYSVAGVGDFNGDGKSDIIWFNSSTRDTYVWLMNGLSMASSSYIYTAAANYSIAGVGDFDADGKSDLIWFNNATGDTYVWLMNGLTFKTSAFLYQVASNFRIVGVADFGGDGKADLTWRNTSTGDTYIWTMNGTTYTSSTFIYAPTTQWNAVAPGKF